MGVSGQLQAVADLDVETKKKILIPVDTRVSFFQPVTSHYTEIKAQFITKW
jgi:hypothetical protein